MGPVRRSARIRKARSRRSRPSDSGHRRPLQARAKQRSSQVQNDNAAKMVSRALNFADVDDSFPPRPVTSATGTTGTIERRRSDRLLRRNSINQGPLFSTPTASSPIPDGELLDRKDAPGSTLEQIQLVPGDDNKILESMFGEVFDKAALCKLEVEQCVSLPELRVRPLHQFGIRRAGHLLRGKSIGSVTGHVCVGKFPVVAELPDEYQDRILEYFCKQGGDREASKRFIASRAIYHVVNGGYEHEGRWRLLDISGYQFTGIKWRTVRIPWQNPKIIRAISIMSSQVQKKELVVELSFLDEMVHLRRVTDEHIMENGIVLEPQKPLPRGFCKDVSKAYTGGKDYSNNTLRHLISVAAKMSVQTVMLMRQVIDEECPDIAKSIHRKASCEDSHDVIDTRVFRTLINSKTLRGSKLFFAHNTKDEDRQNALHRLRYIAQEKGSYKGVDPKTLDSQVRAAIAARKAIDEFHVRILRTDLWPPAIKPLLRNILWTTKLDADIEEKGRKTDELLLVLKHKYLECAGYEGGCRVEQYEKYVLDQARKGKGNTGTSAEPYGNNVGSPSGAVALDEGVVDERDPDAPIDAEAGDQLGTSQSPSDTVDTPSQQDQVGINDETTDTEPVQDPTPEPEPDPLQQCEIEVHALTWEDYNRTVLTAQEVFDFIISDPFQKAAAAHTPVIDDDRRTQFVQFVKKVLVPGGYVFVIVPQLEVSAWLETFSCFELKSEGIFTLVKDPESVQRVKGKSFQQNLIEVAVVARKPGRHPTKFVMDVVSPYTQLPGNRYKRRAPVIDSISPPSNRLRFPRSKTLLRTGEKSSAVIWELMKTFCPPGGKALDPFGHTMTTGIAGIESGRPCVILETDEECFSLAVTRLREIALQKVKERDAGHLLSELGTNDVVLDCSSSLDTPEAESDDRERDLRSLRPSGGVGEGLDCSDRTTDVTQCAQHSTEIDQHSIEKRDINVVDTDECHSGSRGLIIREKDAADLESCDDRQDESGNNCTEIDKDNGNAIPTAGQPGCCPENVEKETAATQDQDCCHLQRFDAQSSVVSPSEDHTGHIDDLENIVEIPYKGTRQVTRKRKGRNEAGNVTVPVPVPTSSRPQRRRKKNIRYG